MALAGELAAAALSVEGMGRAMMRAMLKTAKAAGFVFSSSKGAAEAPV
jgi:hypothetical protein